MWEINFCPFLSWSLWCFVTAAWAIWNKHMRHTEKAQQHWPLWNVMSESRDHYTLVSAGRAKTLNVSNVGKDAENIMVKWYAMLEKNWHLKKKLNICISCNSAVTLMGHLSQRNENLCSPKNLFKNLHGSFICDSLKLEVTQMSFNG